MKKYLLLFLLLPVLIQPASALELTAPQVPEAGAQLMPEDTSSFSDALWSMVKKALGALRPDLREASRISAAIVCTGLILSILQGFSGCPKKLLTAAGTLTAASLCLGSTNSLIGLARATIGELGQSGKLLLPVMTASLAAQGGAATSTALYTGTALFDLLLSSLIARLLVPMVYLFLSLSLAAAVGSEDLLKKLREMLRQLSVWSLKTLLTVYTAYMSLTGVISGTTDAAALKATKMTISTVVPVVGGILSDASETVLVSAGLIKNAAGIYGILALLAVFLSPFLTIGVHYLLMKLTAALCGLLGSKELTELTGDLSTAMGLLLAMTGSQCLLQLVSTVCFLKGIP